jgi:hypothetical protein
LKCGIRLRYPIYYQFLTLWARVQDQRASPIVNGLDSMEKKSPGALNISFRSGPSIFVLLLIGKTGSKVEISPSKMSNVEMRPPLF